MKPFLKWAGGKRWLLASPYFATPRIQGRYIEPFLGGGAVFFGVLPSRAILSDVNPRLIELYVSVRDHVEEFESLLRHHAAAHSMEYYYEVRGKSFRKPVARAAQLLYLNRTCWNGLYRVNRRGQFNVPIGTKDTVVFETDDFGAWSASLRSAEIHARDFEVAIDQAVEGDYVFVDPPYTVRHNVNGFSKYNEHIFSWKDQLRLRSSLERAVRRGASFAMTNADHVSIRDLYRGFGSHARLHRHSVIAANSRYRSTCTELLVEAAGSTAPIADLHETAVNRVPVPPP